MSIPLTTKKPGKNIQAIEPFGDVINDHGEVHDPHHAQKDERQNQVDPFQRGVLERDQVAGREQKGQPKIEHEIDFPVELHTLNQTASPFSGSTSSELDERFSEDSFSRAATLMMLIGMAMAAEVKTTKNRIRATFRNR